MTTIGPDRCRELLDEAPVGRLATVTGDGRPHLVPCCFVLVGDHLYSVVDGKPKSTSQLRRLDNIRANPAAALLVDHYHDDWTQLWWVRADGTARVIDPVAGLSIGDRVEYVAAVDALVESYPPYRETRPDGALVAIDIDRLSGWAWSDG
ncbi:MAG: TIGR03668 family PPOX class F420-dependent oxidoreductase [Actinomycetota bacterium]